MKVETVMGNGLANNCHDDNHVNSVKMTPDTTMSDKLTSSSLATPTESRIMSAQLMSDSTQYDMRAALSQATVQHISIKSRVSRFERYITSCFKANL